MLKFIFHLIIFGSLFFGALLLDYLFLRELYQPFFTHWGEFQDFVPLGFFFFASAIAYAYLEAWLEGKIFGHGQTLSRKARSPTHSLRFQLGDFHLVVARTDEHLHIHCPLIWEPASVRSARIFPPTGFPFP